jgi:hypothetical protein
MIIEADSMLSERLRESWSWSLRRPLTSIGLLLGVFLLFQSEVFYPTIRFSSRMANYLVVLLTCVFPWIGLRYVLELRNEWKWGIACVMVFPLLLWSLISGAGTALSMLVDDTRTIAQVQMGRYHVGIYADNEGGTVLVRQERSLLRGLMVVRDLDSFLDTDDASCRVVATNTLQIEVPVYTMGKDFEYHRTGTTGKTYHLEPFVYF